MEPLEREFIPYREAVEIDHEVDSFAETLENYDDFEIRRLCLELYESNLVKDRRMHSEESQEPQPQEEPQVFVGNHQMIFLMLSILDQRLKNLSAFCGLLFLLLMLSILLR